MTTVVVPPPQIPVTAEPHRGWPRRHLPFLVAAATVAVGLVVLVAMIAVRGGNETTTPRVAPAPVAQLGPQTYAEFIAGEIAAMAPMQGSQLYAEQRRLERDSLSSTAVAPTGLADFLQQEVLEISGTDVASQTRGASYFVFRDGERQALR